jgi:poly(3-hydroxybutyrate) depolymerase
VQRSVYFPGGGVCRAGSLVAGGWRNRVTVESPAGGGTRSFLLVLPRNYAANAPMPLLLALHGGAAYATNFLDFSYLDSRGIDAGFAVASPDGLPGTLRVGGVWRLQNAAGDGAGDVHPEVDDLAFIADVTRCIGALGVPLSGRMSVAGFSLGAKFANLVACAPPPGFATAAVVVAGGLQEPRPASCHVPMLMFQGGADPQVPFCTRAANMGPMAYWPTRVHFEAWLLSNGADEALQSTQCSLLGDSVLYEHPPARGGARTLLFWRPAGSHVWPGALAGCSRDGTDIALDFMSDPAQPLRCDGLSACTRDPPCGVGGPWTAASMR